MRTLSQRAASSHRAPSASVAASSEVSSTLGRCSRSRSWPSASVRGASRMVQHMPSSTRSLRIRLESEATRDRRSFRTRLSRRWLFGRRVSAVGSKSIGSLAVAMLLHSLGEQVARNLSACGRTQFHPFSRSAAWLMVRTGRGIYELWTKTEARLHTFSGVYIVADILAIRIVIEYDRMAQQTRCSEPGDGAPVCNRGPVAPGHCSGTFGNMSQIAIESHRGLFYALFAVFEAILLTSAVMLWCIEPRRMSGLDGAAGTAFWFSFAGLSVVSWLLRRAAPRVSIVGFITVVGSFIACSLLPAVP